MAHMIPNQFTAYQLNDQEQLEGACLTITQKQLIQNRLSDAATKQLNLDYDPAEPLLFVQAEAYNTGQIEAYQFLLDSSAAAEEVLNPVPPQPTTN